MKKNGVDAVYHFLVTQINGMGPQKALKLKQKYGGDFEALKNDEFFHCSEWRMDKSARAIKYAVQKFSSFSYCPYCGRPLVPISVFCKKCKLSFKEKTKSRGTLQHKNENGEGVE